jgi:hypothetical protein
MPSVSERAAAGIYGVTGAIVLSLCSLPNLDDDLSTKCDIRPRRDVIVPAVKKPVINR